jgi:hypothetical protein
MLACCDRQIVETRNLVSSELEHVGGDVLFHSRDALRARNRSDVVTLRKKPGDGNLSRSRVPMPTGTWGLTPGAVGRVRPISLTGWA